MLSFFPTIKITFMLWSFKVCANFLKLVFNFRWAYHVLNTFSIRSCLPTNLEVKTYTLLVSIFHLYKRSTHFCNAPGVSTKYLNTLNPKRLLVVKFKNVLNENVGGNRQKISNEIKLILYNNRPN